MNDLEERTLALGRYSRKPGMIFFNVEVELSLMSNIMSMLNYVIQIIVTEKNIAACHPLNKARVTPIIVKFIYHEHQDLA